MKFEGLCVAVAAACRTGNDRSTAKDDAGLSFPCKLKFDLVAPGSQVIAARAGREKPKEDLAGVYCARLWCLMSPT